VSHVLLPPSTPTMGRQDHTSLPYASVPFVKGTSASTAPTLKDWAGKTLPALQHHLEMAQAIDKNRK